MAKQTNAKIGFENELWAAADAMRGNVSASDYRKIVVGLIFLKYVSDAFDFRYQEYPLTPRGSYAGAMGYGQFMPCSFRSYAVDFDGDGHRDLWRNPRDAIGSVANYFKKHGWRTGEPVAVPAQVSGGDYAALISRQLKPPQHRVARLRAQGVIPLEPVGDAQTSMLLELQSREGPEYWLGFDNFYVITRYNHSSLYAMAVYQLSREIRERYEQRPYAGAPVPERMTRAD